MTNDFNSEVKATVTTVTGEVKKFGDSVSAFIVTHPKTGAIIALVSGWIFGWFVHP